MVSAERRSEEDSRAELLAPLGEMGDIRKELERLIKQKKPLEREVVLDVLRSEQEAYSLPVLGRQFEKKALALGEIIEAFEKEQFGVSDLLEAVGMSTTETKTKSGSFKGFLRKFRP